MGFRHFTLIAGMLFASHAMAIVISPVHSKTPECDGKTTSFQANVQDLQSIDLSELIHKTAVAKDDTRVGLNNFKPKDLPPLTGEEAALIRKTIGRCNCEFLAENESSPKTIYSSCFIAGNRGTNAELHFNAHLIRPFFTPDGVQKPGKLSCTFANKAGDKPAKFSLVPGTFRVGSLVPNDTAEDKAVVKLSQPIPGVVELPILDGAATITEGMSLYLFSAEQDRMKVKVNANQPIAQEVKVLNVYRNSAGEIKAFSTTGSATKHTSGSVYAVRDSQGGLAAVGMIQSSSPDENDGQPVFTKDPISGKTLISNGNVAIPMSPGFTAEDKQMAEGSVLNSAIPAATKGL